MFIQLFHLLSPFLCCRILNSSISLSLFAILWDYILRLLELLLHFSYSYSSMFISVFYEVYDIFCHLCFRSSNYLFFRTLSAAVADTCFIVFYLIILLLLVARTFVSLRMLVVLSADLVCQYCIWLGFSSSLILVLHCTWLKFGYDRCLNPSVDNFDQIIFGFGISS